MMTSVIIQYRNCMFLFDYIVYYYILFILDYRYIVYFLLQFEFLVFYVTLSNIMATNLQSRVWTHAILVIGLYELLDPTT